MKELANTGMVEVYNNQYLWDNRSTQRVYDAFATVRLGTPSMVKNAQRELVERGLMVIRRRKRNASALKWALTPGAVGETELSVLLERGDIDYQIYQATLFRRASYDPP